jgi:hypothetical protein
MRRTVAATVSVLLAGSMTFASGWECSEVEGKVPEYSRGGRYLVTLSYDVSRPGVPALLVISDAEFPKGKQVLATREAADLHHKSGPQEHWPNTQGRENTTYTAAGLRRGEDEIDDIRLISFIVDANPTTEELGDGEKRVGLLEVRYRGGRVRRDLNCRYEAR